MSDESPRKATRRAVLATIGAAGGGAAIANALTGEQGDLYGGQMALDKAYKVGERLWIGPDSARSNINAKDGRVFIGASGDGYTFYNGDGGAWDSKGLGDSSNPLASVTTERLNNAHYASAYDGATGGDQIQNAIDASESESGPNVVVVDGPGPDDVSSYSGALADYATTAWALPDVLQVGSYTTLFLKNCYLFNTNDTDDNLIRNKGIDNGKVQNENITIAGIGQPIIDGDNNNHSHGGGTSMSLDAIGLRFFKTPGLTVQNIKVRNTNGWGMKIEDADEFLVENYRVSQNGVTNNEDGVKAIGPIQGGVIDKAIGTTQDDMTSLSATSSDGKPSGNVLDGSGGDIEDCTIRNVSVDTASNKAATPVRLLAGDGYTQEKTSIRNIRRHDPGRCVRIGWSSVDTQPALDEFTQISISNIASGDEGSGITGSDELVTIVSPCSNVSISNASAKRLPGGLLRCEAPAKNIRISDSEVVGDVNNAVSVKFNPIDGLSIVNTTISGVKSNGRLVDNDQQITRLFIDQLQVDGIGTLFDFKQYVNGRINGAEADRENIGTVYNNTYDLAISNDAPSQSAPSVSIIDDFEDGDISEYGGDTGSMSITTSTVYEGSEALSSSSDGASIASTTGLANYPDTSNLPTAYFRATGDDLMSFGFGTQSETSKPDGYYATIDNNINEIRLEKVTSGSFSTLDTATYNGLGDIRDVWIEVKVVEWDSSGNITAVVSLEDGTPVGAVSVDNDSSPYTSGGIAWILSSSCVADYAHI